MWLKDKVAANMGQANLFDKIVERLGKGPTLLVKTYQGYEINGYTFCTKMRDEKSTVQNSGVTVIASTGIAKKSYYGVIQEIWELDYYSFKIPLFMCWICYAEKTLGSYVLPYISSVKSPQQSIEAIIKHHLCQKSGLRPGDIYHVTVMPCYDKKLEASRDDFVFRDQSDGDDQMTTEVDSVLTTGEVVDLIQSKAVDFSNLDEAPLDKLQVEQILASLKFNPSNVSEEGHLFGVRGSSGGYTDTVFRYAAKTLFDQDIKGPLEFRTLRNSDFKEVTLEVEGKTVLKFALCYGFRNLQNVVRKIKDGKSDYHYLEIMACPSGCLNGGGQLKPEPGQSGKDLVQALETTYMENVLVADPFENPS